jgi:hypothetical protein
MNISTYFYFLNNDTGNFATNFKVKVPEALSITETQIKGYELLRDLQQYSPYVTDFISFQLNDNYDPDQYIHDYYCWIENGCVPYRTAAEIAAELSGDPSVSLDIQLDLARTRDTARVANKNKVKHGIVSYTCGCGRKFKKGGWFMKHQVSCEMA